MAGDVYELHVGQQQNFREVTTRRGPRTTIKERRYESGRDGFGETLQKRTRPWAQAGVVVGLLFLGVAGFLYGDAHNHPSVDSNETTPSLWYMSSGYLMGTFMTLSGGLFLGLGSHELHRTRKSIISREIAQEVVSDKIKPDGEVAPSQEQDVSLVLQIPESMREKVKEIKRYRVDLVTDTTGNARIDPSLFPSSILAAYGGRTSKADVVIEDLIVGTLALDWAWEFHTEAAWSQLMKDFNVEAGKNYLEVFRGSSHDATVTARVKCAEISQTLESSARVAQGDDLDSRVLIYQRLLEVEGLHQGKLTFITSGRFQSSIDRCRTVWSERDREHLSRGFAALAEAEVVSYGKWRIHLQEKVNALIQDDELDKALELTEQGLTEYPDDRMLQELRSRIRMLMKDSARASIKTSINADDFHSATTLLESAIASGLFSDKEATSLKAQISSASDRDYAKRRAQGERNYSIEMHVGIIGNVWDASYPTVTDRSMAGRITKACQAFCGNALNLYACMSKCESACRNGSHVQTHYGSRGSSTEITIVCKEE